MIFVNHNLFQNLETTQPTCSLRVMHATGVLCVWYNVCAEHDPYRGIGEHKCEEVPTHMGANNIQSPREWQAPVTTLDGCWYECCAVMRDSAGGQAGNPLDSVNEIGDLGALRYFEVWNIKNTYK